MQLQAHVTMHRNTVAWLNLQVTHGGLDGLHYTNTSYEFLRKYGGKKSHQAQRLLESLQKGVHFPAGVPVNTMQCLVKVGLFLCLEANACDLIQRPTDSICCSWLDTEN